MADMIDYLLLKVCHRTEQERSIYGAYYILQGKKICPGGPG